MTDVASLPPVKPVELVTSKDDRFHCVPLRVDMLVLGCVQRQAIVRSGKKRLDWSQCISCELGRAIEKASGGAMVVTQHKNDKKHGGCGSNPSGLTYRPKKRLPVLPVVDESANDDGRNADQGDATLPTLGASLSPRLTRDPADDEADDEADEQENDIQQRDTEPAPPPKRERKTKMAMTPEEKKIKQREWQRKYQARKRAEREAAAGKPAKTVAPGVTISKGRRGAPIKRTQRTATPAPASSGGALAEQLTRAVEAVELCDRIGWDLARSLAARMGEANP